MENILRVISCSIRQPHFTAPRKDLSSQTILITGPTIGGIDQTTASTLCHFGARVLHAGRNPTTGLQAISDVKQRVPGTKVDFVPCDLANLDSVQACVEELKDVQIDVLVCNAGVALKEHAKNGKGVEMTFAVCVLGHHLLVEKLRPRRVVLVTGDVYVLAGEVVDPFGEGGGAQSYFTACLARLWMVGEWKKMGIEMVGVHPGVINSGLAQLNGAMKKLAGWLLLDVEQGAQASVLTASAGKEDIRQEDKVPYYHNKFGWMDLGVGDKAINEMEARKLFEKCDELCGISRD